MADKYQKYIKAISVLPYGIQLWCESPAQGRAITTVATQHGLKRADLADLIIDLFINGLDLSRIAYLLKERFNISDGSADKATIDLLGCVFLPINDEIKDTDVAALIDKLGGKPGDYKRWQDEFRRYVEQYSGEALDNLISIYEKEIDPDEEADIALDLVRSNLVEILRDSSPAAAATLNGGLVYLLFNRQGFKNDLVKQLMNNDQDLTSQKIIIDSKEVRPTAANWLLDFIKRHGTDNFDNLLVTKYITKSDNAKLLNDREKKLVRRLLQFYRNVKFFPDSLRKVPVGDWEIIPTQKTESQMPKARRVSGPPRTEEEKDIERLKEEEGKYQSGGLERLVIEEEVDRKKRIEELRAMAGKYSEGSLERRAVEEEISRLEKR